MVEDVILETENLTMEFRGFVAVNGVNLRIRRGTIHALIGPNGAGKTTCFNLLTKFLTPTMGRIIYNGREITRTAPADIARLGLVRSFQISAVFPHLTALQNARIALQRRRGSSFDFWRSERVLDVYNKSVEFSNPGEARRELGFLKPTERAGACTECLDCEGKCPQEVPVHEWMKRIAAEFGA